MTLIHYQNNELFVENVPAKSLAEQFDTPLYVYSQGTITAAYEAFCQAFEKHPIMICYAVKANANLGVLSLLAQLGAGFDIVSGGELERVLRAGGDPTKIVFSGVGKQDWEIQSALQAGIACFNIESSMELDQIQRLAHSMDLIAPISVRVNPDVDAGTHPYISTGLRENKFGVSMEDAPGLYQRARDLSHIETKGIDCHIGSQITELAPFMDAMSRVLSLVDDLAIAGINLAHIDLGGGLGVCYDDETPVDIVEYAGAILQGMGHRPQTIVFEPGRYLTANAGILLTRVVNIKTNEDKHFAIVDAGMNDLIRPALYQSWQRITEVEARNSDKEMFEVVGPICESGDFLGKNRSLAIEAGDLLAIHSVGAYGFAMSSNYNSRNRAAEVIVSGATTQCVRQRETIDDQLRLERCLVF
ncbi:diaminopimelate decarboxylase [Pseudomonadales bacterium]|nr:diaminopimelate decarboxylase [Pseudomonadales bacterium]MDA9064046.1 diaminopimelate decarboxylase [Pseudomonadales bacterium]MDA9285591.1 diaminopimelate decarboxylase [Pseudomonadales bacterium]MDB4150972.1 diaminopimelate decarboxylase [Pseudomonadales bacterium]MDB9866503.1 diaminopimelate decarboxylase [Pseudomonadales bacterium]